MTSGSPRGNNSQWELSTGRLLMTSGSTKAIGSTQQIHARSNRRAAIFHHNRPHIIPIKRKYGEAPTHLLLEWTRQEYHARSTHQPTQRVTVTKQLLDGSFPSFIPINGNLYSTKTIVIIEWKCYWLLLVTLASRSFRSSITPFRILHRRVLSPYSIPPPILSLPYTSCQRTKPRKYYIFGTNPRQHFTAHQVIVLSSSHSD